MRSLLLVSSDVRRELNEVCNGLAPRRDYAELARVLGADVFDFGAVLGSAVWRNIGKIGGRGMAHALMSRMRLREYDVVFSDNERVGVFAALILRSLSDRPRHVVLGHHLSPIKKRPLLLAARSAIDLLIVHSKAQATFAIERLGFARHGVIVLPYQVDTDFWQPEDVPSSALLVTAGLECRDYETMVEAVSDLPVTVKIGAASNWSRKPNRLQRKELPVHISVASYNYRELRSLYSQSSLIVVPLFDVDFQAGVTLILEAMAMKKAVVVTRTLGQTEVVRGPVWTQETKSWPEHGPAITESTGIYVPPANAPALRAATQFLLGNPEDAHQLGENGRRTVETDYRLEQFAERFATAIRSQVDTRQELVDALA